MMRIVRKFFKKYASIKNAFKDCRRYLLPGEYAVDKNISSIILKKEIGNDKIAQFADLGYSKISKTTIRKTIYKYLAKKTFINRNNDSVFNGTYLIISSNSEQYKIIDKKDKTVLTKYLSDSKYKKICNDYEYCKSVYALPDWKIKDDNELYTVEEFIDDDKTVGSEIRLRLIMDLYKQKASDFEKKNDKIKCHGDLWADNTLFKNGKLYVIDIESVGYYSFFYDIFHYIFSEAYLNKNYALIKKYFYGGYDSDFEDYFKKFNRKFNDRTRVEWFNLFMLEYSRNKWVTLNKKTKNIMISDIYKDLNKHIFVGDYNGTVLDTLSGLSLNGVQYVVLRGFKPIGELNKSKDVDIFVPKSYKKMARQYFTQKGWYRQKLNCSRYPHEQYIRMTDVGVKKIDVVYGLYYGNELFHYNAEEHILSNSVCESGIYVPKIEYAIELLMLHVVFDKKILSEENKKRLIALLDGDTKKSRACKDAIALLDNNSHIQSIRSSILKSDVLSFSVTRMIGRGIRHRLNNVIRECMKRLHRRNICFMGVDGSGKSTTIQVLSDILGEQSTVLYMGFKNFKSKGVKKAEGQVKNISRISLCHIMLLQWIEFWRRYMSVRFSKKYVLFDRFPDESIINYKKTSKILAFILFKILFPRPKSVYYLYCSEESSFNRKDDILNKKDFVDRKKKFDEKYINNKKIKSFSTDINTTNDIINEIINDINCKDIKYFI